MVLLPTDPTDSLFPPRCVWVNGAGPSGLAVAACLREQGVPFVVLEREDSVASLWQKRTYDRLKLPRMPFPEDYPEHPTRRQFVDYLEDYAAKFEIKPEFNCHVVSARYDDTQVRDQAGDQARWRWRAVPCTLLPREVVGKSILELAVLLKRWFPLWLVDKILLAWLLLGDLTRFGFRQPTAGPLEVMDAQGQGRVVPVLDSGAVARIRAGDIQVVPAVVGFANGQFQLTDGRAIDADAVVFAAGYRSNVPQWLQDNDLFNKDGYPKTGCCLLEGTVRPLRRRLSASADAVRVANHLGNVWREETKPTKRTSACHRRCISVVFQLL